MMPRRCERCHRPVWVWPWQRALCRGSQFDQCVGIAFAIAVEEGGLEEPGEPDEDNPRPVDIEVCSVCHGKGEVPYRQDWESGLIEFEECRRCQTTGKEPVCLV